MPHSCHPTRTRYAGLRAAALFLLAPTLPAAAATTFTFNFDLTVDTAFDAVSGTSVASPLLGETGTASISFDIDTTLLAANDVLALFNSDVAGFSATLFGQSYDETEAANVTGGPFGPADTPIATLLAGADIETDPTDLELSFLGFGVSELTAIVTSAGGFTFDPSRLTTITEPGVTAFVALFAPSDPADYLADGETGAASVSVGVVPVPPALALALTGLAGFAAVGRRRRVAA